jgi:oligopeptidase B
MDASLPLTTGEYLEWGNPNEKAAYDYMRSYSPYDNLEKKPIRQSWSPPA